MFDTLLEEAPPDTWRKLPGVRSMSAARAALHARLGAGCTLALWPERAPEARMRMTLYALDALDAGAPPAIDWSGAVQLQGPFGVLELSDGARWLRALTGIDLDADAERAAAWLCGAVLGALDGTPLAASAALQRGGAGPLEDECILRWVLHSERHSVACHARASAATWCALLARGAWRLEAAAPGHFARLPVSTAVVLARHTLPGDAAQALRPGDIILPDAPAFACNGQGRLRLGANDAAVAWRAPNHLEILHLEPCMEEYDIDDDVDAPAPAQIGEDAAAPDDDALATVPVTLDFVLGRVQLPLARLQQLAPGSVLELSHGSPALVAIDCGGRLLGHAAIVDVEGRLGLRVTRWGGAA